ncbi:MAG: hypothetical protein ACXVA9_04620 [Bdellovibrionales bacterium]
MNCKWIAGILMLLNTAHAEPRRKIPDPIKSVVTHTLIANAPIKTFNGLTCELVVFRALDYRTAKIVRIDAPSGKLNATYFLEHPSEIANHGIEVVFEKEFFLNGRKIKTVQASFDFENKQRDLILTAFLEGGATLSKTRSVDADFLRDHADHCVR